VIEFVYSVAAALLIGAVSSLGLVVFSQKFIRPGSLTLILVGFAAGALLGDSFFHLLPHAYGPLPPGLAAGLSLFGLLLFLSIEKIFRWRHCHQPDCHDNSRHLARLNLIGDGFHNFVDGILLAASFSVSPSLGLATALAVLVHEIPQEIGDFAVLVHSGLTPRQALKLNLLSALACLAGVFLVFLLSPAIADLTLYLLPITAGGFIYLAASDLIPELHRHSQKISDSFVQVLSILSGILLMYFLSLFE